MYIIVAKFFLESTGQWLTILLKTNQGLSHNGYKAWDII